MCRNRDCPSPSSTSGAWVRRRRCGSDGSRSRWRRRSVGLELDLAAIERMPNTARAQPAAAPGRGAGRAGVVRGAARAPVRRVLPARRGHRRCRDAAERWRWNSACAGSLRRCDARMTPARRSQSGRRGRALFRVQRAASPSPARRMPAVLVTGHDGSRRMQRATPKPLMTPTPPSSSSPACASTCRNTGRPCSRPSCRGCIPCRRWSRTSSVAPRASKRWTSALRAIDGPVILVAHSAGVMMVAHWAQC